ncbi:hypothetical protein H2248_011703 [Termitomyces sp. 'cryptogamus']|nr:hypothetical protein H2248_011703 [Termitomyces sp. 'cryptogamus']
MSVTTHAQGDQACTEILSSTKRCIPATAEPTLNELWKWTLTREAIASCFVNDVFVMRENATKEVDFYWLGRVPCRSVRIAGLLVGIQVYEKRIRYTVDDGTAVVDCLHKQSPPPRSSVKDTTDSRNPPMNTKSKALSWQPKPLARVGNSIIVTGRVIRKYDTREIIVESIGKVSRNDEVQHWARVHQLHAEHYFLSTLFEIPTLSSSPCEVSTIVAPATPVKNVATSRHDVCDAEALMPATALAISHNTTSPASIQTTPSNTRTISPSPSLTSSPAKSAATQSPQKLRHPSRLHSRDLNGNTFRIYVKHYMDRMVYDSPTSEADNESDTRFIDECPTTPTRPSPHFATDDTPRAGSSKPPELSKAPRPRISPLSFDGQLHLEHSSTVKDTPIMKGFTLSYLRRVPELADMAKRVVKAVTKRRLREERHKAKEAAAARSVKCTQAKASTGPRTGTVMQVEGGNGPRIKRLFQATIVQLLKEGSIVLWDGPIYPCPTADKPKEQVGGLWKANVTSTSTDSTLLSAGSVTIIGDEGEEDVLSEPDNNEEAYVPLSPAFLAEVVEEAIGKLTCSPTVPGLARGKKQNNKWSRATTKEGILAFLRKDDRWRYLSEWNIREALDVLEVEQRAWCIGRGLWELSL